MPRSDVRDVVVIGGGPAGSMAARRLAERGHDVVLVEEHDTSGVPVHCTGLLGEDAFDEFDLPRQTILGVAAAARFWAGDGGSVLIASEQIKAAVIDRALFDQDMSRRAVAAGVELRLGWRAEAMRIDRPAVEVRNGSGSSVVARACILACGANYRFHRQIGLGMPRAYLQSAQLETPFPACAQIEVKFGHQVAPKGFAWLVPFKRAAETYARIGLMCADDGGSRFDGFVQALCAEQGIDPQMLGAARRKVLPLGPVSKTFASRVLAVGDAAGLVKPTTGGGIFYGLISGALAAESLDANLRCDRLADSDLKSYETRWRQRLGPDIRIGLAFRRLAERFDDRAINSVIELARVDGIVPLLKETASFNWHRQAAIALLNHTAFRRILVRALCA
ncbi:MAG: geranylgeranyl reductase family protein [Vicinamibacterales bacterium]